MVYTGPTKTGASLIAAVAADTDRQTPPKRRGRKTVVVAVKKNDLAKGDDNTDAKPPALRHANAKPEGAAKTRDNKTGDGKAAVAGAPAAKPAKPKAAAKPKSDAKPPKSNS
jgi:D-alanyl-D-alanine carboxypeptidase